MKILHFLVVLLLMTITVPIMAQTNYNSQENQDTPKVRVEMKNGQSCLVLSTGRHANAQTIAIELDNNTWKTLDSLLATPRSVLTSMKDIKGYKVEIANARVNSQTGLMFTSGPKCVAITKEEYEALAHSR